MRTIVASLCRLIFTRAARRSIADLALMAAKAEDLQLMRLCQTAEHNLTELLTARITCGQCHERIDAISQIARRAFCQGAGIAYYDEARHAAR